MSGINQSQKAKNERRRIKAKGEAEKIYEFTLAEAERFAETSNDLVSLIMVANLKYNGFYACKIDGVKVYFERIRKTLPSTAQN